MDSKVAELPPPPNDRSVVGHESSVVSTSEGKTAVKYSCELSRLHVDSARFPKVPVILPKENFSLWHEAYGRDSDKDGVLALWINHTISQLPAGVELSREVDEGGNTDHIVKAKMYTRWVKFADVDESTVYARFSQARTAMHFGGALRTPVEMGVALEITTDPDSLDPRDVVTQTIYKFPRKIDANFPWLDARRGRILDLSPVSEPTHPLFSDPRNEITDPLALEKARTAAIYVLSKTVEACL